MFEFLIFLSSNDKKILDNLYQAGFSIEENSVPCLLGERYFGFIKKSQKTIVICTRNAMKMGGHSIPRSNDDWDPTKIYIRKALRHEATHAAQVCNNGKLLNMVKKERMKLHPFKKEALEASTKLSGNREEEYEAYWMEDRPKMVLKALKKYCL